MINFVEQFGSNSDVDQNSTEDLWNVGDMYTWPTANAATTVASSAAADGVSGRGVRVVQVQGIVISADGSYEHTTEDVTLNGVTPVALANNFYRVHRAIGLATGADYANAGDIDVKHGSTVLSRISAGDGQSLQAIYTVPELRGSGMYLKRWAFDASRQNVTIECKLLTREPNGRPWRVRDIGGATDGTRFVHMWDQDALLLTPGTDVRILVSDVSSNNTRVHGGFSLTADRVE